MTYLVHVCHKGTRGYYCYYQTCMPKVRLEFTLSLLCYCETSKINHFFPLTVSILIFLFIGILVVSEFWYYRAVETKYDYEVDTDTDRCVPVMDDQNIHVLLYGKLNLIGSFLVRILPYGPFPWKWSSAVNFLLSKAGRFKTSMTPVPYNKLLTNLVSSSCTREYWPSYCHNFGPIFPSTALTLS